MKSRKARKVKKSKKYFTKKLSRKVSRKNKKTRSRKRRGGIKVKTLKNIGKGALLVGSVIPITAGPARAARLAIAKANQARKKALEAKKKALAKANQAKKKALEAKKHALAKKAEAEKKVLEAKNQMHVTVPIGGKNRKDKGNKTHRKGGASLNELNDDVLSLILDNLSIYTIDQLRKTNKTLNNMLSQSPHKEMIKNKAEIENAKIKIQKQKDEEYSEFMYDQVYGDWR